MLVRQTLSWRSPLSYSKVERYALALCALFYFGIFALPAQDGVSTNTAQEQQLVDPLHNAQMAAILHQMDIFNGDSATVLIGSLLSAIEEDEIEIRYYLLSYRAEVLYYEGLFNEAMRDLDRAEQMAFQLDDSLKIANVYNLKGLLHENIQNGDLAIPYLKKALHWFPVRSRTSWPLSELHHIHGNLGTYLTRSLNSDSAEYHLRRSLALATLAGQGRAIAVANWSLGELDLELQNTDSALTHFARAFKGTLDSKDQDVALDALVGKAKALILLRRMEEAERTLAIAEQHLSIHMNEIGAATRRNFARDASRAYEDMGDVKNALSQTHVWRNLDSTIAARNTHQALATQADLLQTDNELLNERNERERVAEVLRIERYRRNMWLIGAALILFVFTMIFYVNALRHRNKRKLAESEILRVQQAGLIHELQLREEIGRDLHDDIGVGLSGIKLRSEMALRVEQDSDKRAQLSKLAVSAGDLIGNMRQIIWSMNPDQEKVEDLVVYTCNYARTYALENSYELEVVANGPWPERSLTSEQRRNVFLSVKEALHNVVKHANASKVSLHISSHSDLSVEITDNGNGLPEGADMGEGNGLRNIRKRILSLQGRIEIRSQNGTRIRFSIPLANIGNEGSIVGAART